jgi:DNA-binding CsgD family transcriptional regulator
LLKSPDGPRGTGMPCYLLRLPEVSESYQLGGDPAILLLVPQAAPSAPEAVALLRTLYSLSRREADLATAVANGATPQDYAKKAGLEISTVRSQLKSVFQKTGTHRQTELVRLLSVLPRVTLG